MFMVAAPFKFDVPSPDELVSNGMHASKLASKGSTLWLQIELWPC